MGTQDRRAIHAHVSDRAHDQWHTFAAGSGVSVSAILEALATHLPTETTPDRTDESEWTVADLVAEARRIDSVRRRRTRD